MPEIFPSVKSAYGITRSPYFNTVIVSYGHYVEQRRALDNTARYAFKLIFPVLSEHDADSIFDFFIARKGSYETFYFRNQEEAYRTTKWVANTYYSVGDIVRPVVATGRSYKCTTAGTSHTVTQPTWPTSFHDTVSDGTVVWTENSYRVRFAADSLNMEGFTYGLYNLGEITLIEVYE